jgi:UDP-N-acetylmuramyl tripeptide synthase
VWRDGRLDDNLAYVYDTDGHLRELFRPTPPPLTYTKLAVSRACGRVSRSAGRGGGTTAPGRLLLRMAPRAIETLAARLPQGVILVSATNGKTTTARMLAEILRVHGHTVVHNRAGANTHWGIATALADRDGDVAVLEVDEAWLPLLAAQVHPRVVVLGNLFRDRLDGYGELRRLTELWRTLLTGPNCPATVVANADDPLLAGPGGVLEPTLAPTLLFGLADVDLGTPTPQHPHDAVTCAACDTRLDYARAFIGHLGHYRCPRCRATRPQPAMRAGAISLHGLGGTEAVVTLPEGRVEVTLAQPGLHNLYNALAAAGAAVALGVPPATIAAGLLSTRAPFGRGEILHLDGRTVNLLLVKNPVGANVTLELLRAGARPASLHLWLALNDAVADGRDVSWIWDADFEQLAPLVAAVTCSGQRAAELALRLKYAGWNCPIEVDRDLARSFRAALRGAPDRLIVVPTYTALLGLRPVLNDHGVTVTDWGTTARLGALTPPREL